MTLILLGVHAAHMQNMVLSLCVYSQTGTVKLR